MRVPRFFPLLLTCAAAWAQPAATGFDPVWMDRATEPCTDFYQFACGNWIKKNPIPADESRWGRFNELAERNLAILREILEQAAKPSSGRGVNEQKIGDDYASCMDEATIEKKGIAPIQPELNRIAALKNKSELAAMVARLHASWIPAMFGFRAAADYKNSKVNIANVGQGGLSLPDRDYYLKDDPKSVEIRKLFLEHMERMFSLLGASKESARAVMEIETALARGSLDRVSRRDPNRVYHKMPLGELEKLAPSFAWRKYFAALGAPAFDSLNVAVPEFMKTLEARNRLGESGPMEGLPLLARGSRRRAAAAQRVRERELRVLRQDAHRRQGIAAALEALRGADRQRTRRSAGPGFRRARFRRRGQEARAGDGPRARARPGPRHPGPGVDDAANQGSRRW